ncbi:hypothetical protein BDEG_27862 [Batrachochytrium dendrobatidis JEL423]|uniref:Vesicle tethering protein Uso1/P115-like head domain-containing protein n=1 Tax=Batrachochytrium dendrobatidis (strain JEL423) TaxID=403673 RepID=A0A177WXJ5_BATDL|nr:hypothetical protein BDEG_27862 [Batrachochytrium dendrobatidis JEL423]
MSGYSALKGQKGQPQSPQETIDKLCDRVMNSTLLEDRRAAVQVLRGLARDWQLDVGTKAMSALINVLKSDRMDVEIIKSTLETLNILCAQEATTPKTTDPANNDGHDVGTMFTEIYTKDAANVTLLLDILAELDFYVRLDTVQFLTTLLHNAGPHLQDCVLTSPMGISRLIDLLDDRREIIRNEGLLLLISLTQSNADIQKIIAFENAFERLLSIILDEGATDGGIIVQDCLQLMQNLLRHNVSNQNLFRETSCIKQLGKLLVSKVLSHDHNNATDLPLTHERTEWTDQKMANVNSVLELVCILVAEKNPNTSMNQTALGHANVIVPLFQLGMALHVPTRVRAQALFTVADAIRGNLVNQETFGKSVITVVTRPEHVGVSNQKQSPGAPRPSIINLPVSPGSLLISSILDLDESRKDSFISWFATSIFQHLIRDNRQSKQTAALIKFEEGEEHISLLHKCMYTLLCASRNGVHLRVQIGLWTLLAQWLYDCPRAVKEFLTEGSNMQFLVEQVNQSSGVNAVVQGLAAFIIGLCYEFNDDSEPVFSRANIQGLVMSRIGSDVFQSRLERLRESKQFNSSFLHILKKNEIVDPKNGPEIYFDHSFVEFFKSHYDLMIRSVTTVLPKDAPPGHRHGVDESSTHTNHLRDNSTSPMHNGFNEAAVNEIAQHKAALEALEKTVASQQEHIKKLESTLAQFNQPESNNSTQVNQLTTTITELQLSLDQERAKRLEIEQEQEDLLVCFAEQDMENSELKNRLKTYGEVFEENDE